MSYAETVGPEFGRALASVARDEDPSATEVPPDMIRRAIAEWNLSPAAMAIAVRTARRLLATTRGPIEL